MHAKARGRQAYWTGHEGVIVTLRQYIEGFVETHVAIGVCFSIARAKHKNHIIRHLETITIARIITRKKTVDNVVKYLLRAATEDLKKHPPTSPNAGFKITSTDTSRRRHWKTFYVKHDPTDDDVVHDRCGDCSGSGWYVGLVERRHCPTCDGSGYL